jgi:hypothetical protein
LIRQRIDSPADIINVSVKSSRIGQRRWAHEKSYGITSETNQGISFGL